MSTLIPESFSPLWQMVPFQTAPRYSFKKRVFFCSPFNWDLSIQGTSTIIGSLRLTYFQALLRFAPAKTALDVCALLKAYFFPFFGSWSRMLWNPQFSSLGVFFWVWLRWKSFSIRQPMIKTRVLKLCDHPLQTHYQLFYAGFNSSA